MTKTVTTKCLDNNTRGTGADVSVLEVGAAYEVDRVEVHSWNTLIYLKGYPQGFNSVHFDLDLDPYLSAWWNQQLTP